MSSPPPGFRPIARRTPDLSPVEPIETHAQRARRLMAEARAEAAGHIEDFLARAEAFQAMAAEIATGGDVYPVGVREEARQLADALPNVTRRIEKALRP